VSTKFGNLTAKQPNLLVKVKLVLPEDIQLSNLVIHSCLPRLKSSINVGYLSVKLSDLLFSLPDHLVTISNLLMEVISELLLLGVVESALKVGAALCHRLSLLGAYNIELLKKILESLDLALGLLALQSHISHKEAKFAAPLSMTVFEFGAEVLTPSLLLPLPSTKISELCVMVFRCIISIAVFLLPYFSFFLRNLLFQPD